MKKLSALILAVLMLAACFAGCGGKDADTAEEPVIEAHGVYHKYLSQSATTLNTMVDTSNPTSEIGGWTRCNFYSQRPTEDGAGWEWWCNLAADFPQKTDEEGKVWRITMNPDFKWENGEPINIDDYIYSM